MGGFVTTSAFDPEQLVRIVDGASRSGDPEVRGAVLRSSAQALFEVESADALAQQAGLEPRPEASRIAASFQRLLGCPPPQPSWTPGREEEIQEDARYDRDSASNTMQNLANHNREVQDAARYYDLDPRAIAVAAQVEIKYNPPSVVSRRFGTHVGRGDGFGAMHDIAIRTVHPEWTDHQMEVARTDARYAPALIAADMDAKARAFEAITGGKISIRNDPVALAWAYNNSLETVIRYANRAADDAGSPSSSTSVIAGSWGSSEWPVTRGRS
jgi:hypothetical protein